MPRTTLDNPPCTGWGGDKTVTQHARSQQPVDKSKVAAMVQNRHRTTPLYARTPQPADKSRVARPSWGPFTRLSGPLNFGCNMHDLRSLRTKLAGKSRSRSDRPRPGPHTRLPERRGAKARERISMYTYINMRWYTVPALRKGPLIQYVYMYIYIYTYIYIYIYIYI